MRLSDQRKLKWALLLMCSASLFFFVAVNQRAQTKTQTPARSGHVNDFAGVVDEKTRQRLENVLENVKQRTGIEFDIATVGSTEGWDIFNFSQQFAQDWNVGSRTSVKKSLLLVVSVADKTSFTQFSKSVQNVLPQGVLGEMRQLLQASINAGQFGEGLSAAVQHFVNLLAQKLAFSTDDLDKPPVSISPAESATTNNAPTKPADESVPTVTTATEAGRTTIRTSGTRGGSSVTKTKRPSLSVDDEAESEEVELTLTLPLEARVAKLKAFLEEYPDSKSKARAMELLISAHAGVGDERLKKGDSVGGIEQFMLAIADAPINSSEKLFSGVISQIPINLYLRGEPAAATKAAQNIETKFGGDPKRLVALSGFYVTIEQGAEATRLATQAVQLAPEAAEAHQALGLAFHISLRLEEAAAKYKRALELDPNLKGARRSLADLNRAFGKSEEALALYRQQLVAEPNDKAARAGAVLSLFDLRRTDEAKSELDNALQTDPRNLLLLAGAAYWFAAHNDSELALTLASKAVEIEPRYTWSQIALARALLAQKKPLEAERALRFARQYGKFPTLDYELASTLVSAGLYDEAAEILVQSFRVKDGQIEAWLAGRTAARGATFIELLAPERKASIFQSAAADSESNAKSLKALLTFATIINADNNAGTIDEQSAIAAAKDFASGDDPARVHRQLYAASRLLQKGIGFQAAYEIVEMARSSSYAGIDVPAVTVAVQADEFREIRARAIASGGTPDIPEAPRNVLSNLLRGRIEDLSGWALFNQDKLDEAVEHLKRATNILPEGTPALRTSFWHLGAALERQGKKEEALSYYIKSYNAGDPDSVRRMVIEQLYRKVNGSLAGLDERIGPAVVASTSIQTPARDETTIASAQPTSSPESNVTTTPGAALMPLAEASPSPARAPSPETPTGSTLPPAPSPSPEVPSSAAPEPLPTSTPETTPAPTPAPTPEPSATSTPEATPAPTPTPTPEAPSATSPSLATSPVETMHKPPRTTVTLSGRVKDSSGTPIPNVVVVLISPQGTVLASTTDEQGKYSFTVAPSEHSYRIIPSKDGFSFEPVDKVLPNVNDDQNDSNFIGMPGRKP